MGRACAFNIPQDSGLSFKVDMPTYFLKTNGVLLFQPWRPRVAVLLERRVEAVNRVRTGREGKKKMELLSKYSKDKVDTLCAVLRSRGMWYWDPDFPGDEEEFKLQIHSCVSPLLWRIYIYIYMYV